MKYIRETLLVVFGALLLVALNFLWDSYNLLTNESGIIWWGLLPLLAILIIPIAMLSIGIYKIDKWEDKKAADKHDELLDAIHENGIVIRDLINEIRQDRNERKQRDNTKDKPTL